MSEDLRELRDRLLTAASQLMDDRDAAAGDAAKVKVAEDEFDRIDVILATIQEVLNTRQELDLDAVADRLEKSIAAQRAVGLTSAIDTLRGIVANLRPAGAGEAGEQADGGVGEQAAGEAGGDAGGAAAEEAGGGADRLPDDQAAVVQRLRQQISAGKIRFDSARLEGELLGLNGGVTVSPKLQSLVLKLSELASPHIRVSSLIRSGTGSHHTTGRAVDIGNEEIASDLLPRVATDAQVAALGIDELIFDAALVGSGDRNKWNYDQGRKHRFDTTTLDAHGNHIHFAVTR